MNDITIKILDLSYLDEIHALLNNNYIEHPSDLYRIVYPKDFIYWYLKYIPNGYIIGLINKKKLIGFVTLIILDVINDDMSTKFAQINLLCIHKSLRGHNLSKILLDKLQYNMNHNIIYYSSKKTNNKISNYVIPINGKKLFSVEFINDPILNHIDNELPNIFHITRNTDLITIKNKLNNFLSKYQVKVFFNDLSTQHFLMPKKDIIYSFIHKDNNMITDFVSFYKSYWYCPNKKKILSIATLGYYFYESMTLTNMIQHILPKLNNYGFDLLFFHNIMDNSNINILKYPIDINIYSNIDIKAHNLAIHPF